MSDQNIKLIGTEQRVTNGTVSVNVLTSRQRYTRALVRGGLSLIISVALIVVPVLHFVLFPLGLVITFLIVASSLRQSSFIAHGTGPCPYCGAEFRIFKRGEKYPFSDVCEKCRRQVTIDRAN